MNDSIDFGFSEMRRLYSIKFQKIIYIRIVREGS